MEDAVFNRGGSQIPPQELCIARLGGKRVPLTYQQEWALNNWMHGKDPYVIGLMFRIRGPLNAEVLRTSLGSIVRRHDALRVRLVEDGGVIEQQITESAACVAVIELCARDGEGEDAIHDVIGTLFRKRIDLAQDPPVNFTLLKCSEKEHVLVCLIHHLVFDVLSATIFSKELWQAYEDLLQGRDISVSDAPMQYSDYAIWQRRERERWLQEHGDYWRSYLAGGGPVQLPYDNGLGGVEQFRW